MKRISLTQSKFAIVDDEDYELVSRFKWQYRKENHNHYARCQVYLGRLGGKIKTGTMYLHRLIMRPTNGMEVDHCNHNGLDCRRSNLRTCTRTQNNQNRLVTWGKSKYKGITWDKDLQKWRAYIKNGGVLKHLGVFFSESQAAVAYDYAAIEYFNEFACTNFPKEDYL